jgi:hypothetical protein
MYLAQEGMRICDRIFAYSKKWKQPINALKTVAELFYTQTKESKINRNEPRKNYIDNFAHNFSQFV